MGIISKLRSAFKFLFNYDILIAINYHSLPNEKYKITYCS